MSIAVVTPWVDHLELVDDYFEAVDDQEPDELLVVDNGSMPPLPFAHIRLDDNTGFSHGCNTGLHAATTDKVVFLNNDIVLTGPGWLGRLDAAIEPGVLVGAVLRSDMHTRVAGIDDPLPYLDGWCLAGMRDDLLQLGGFDEDFDEPAYYSDNDLCLRARCNGIRLREVRVGLHHKIAVTGGFTAHTHQVTAANYKRYADKVRNMLAPMAVA